MPLVFLLAPPQRNPFVITVFVIVFLLWAAPALHGRGHKRKIASEDYGLGFSTEIASPESEVVKAVEAIVNNGIIQGSKEFNKGPVHRERQRRHFLTIISPMERAGKGLLQSAHWRAGSREFQGQQ